MDSARRGVTAFSKTLVRIHWSSMNDVRTEEWSREGKKMRVLRRSRAYCSLSADRNVALSEEVSDGARNSPRVRALPLMKAVSRVRGLVWAQGFLIVSEKCHRPRHGRSFVYARFRTDVSKETRFAKAPINSYWSRSFTSFSPLNPPGRAPTRFLLDLRAARWYSCEPECSRYDNASRTRRLSNSKPIQNDSHYPLTVFEVRWEESEEVRVPLKRSAGA